MNIIYEDNHLLVVEKPYLILSQADKSSRPDLLTNLKKYIKEKYNKDGNVYLGLVHRLDYKVAGLMIFAKTSKAAARLSKEFRENRVKKIYLALTEGFLKKESGIIESTLKRVGDKTILGENGKKSVLKWQLLKKKFINKRQVNLLKIDLLTGFKHQIRAQLAFNLQSPIINDAKYDSQFFKIFKKENLEKQIALWSSELYFKHPVQDKIMEFKLQPFERQLWPWNILL